MTDKKRECPVCRKPATPEFKPFCSKRCADIELGRWLSESYALPADPGSDADEAFESEA
jgi:endogenous inhibitor of DNA gyrase (YacG/DUF329 family)